MVKTSPIDPPVVVSLMGGDPDTQLPPPLHVDDDDDDTSAMIGTVITEQVSLLKKAWKSLSRPHPYWKASPIQRHMWSLVLQTTHPIVGVASTGSGKTLAYALATLVVVSSKNTNSSSILVLVPTRELVHQVAKVFEKVCRAVLQVTDDTTTTIPMVLRIHGGVPKAAQQRQLSEAATAGKAVVVATPGRFLDVCQSTPILPVYSYIILDEADQLSKDGDLGPQVDAILQLTAPTPAADDTSSTRLLLVSATCPEKARLKFQSWLGHETPYALIQVDSILSSSSPQVRATSPTSTIKTSGEEVATPTNVDHSGMKEQQPQQHPHATSFAKIPAHLEQILHVCSEHKKPRKLLHTIHQIYKKYPARRNRPLGIIFVSKIEKIKHITKLLEKEGLVSVELHSQLPPGQERHTNLALFASGQRPLLLATDVAARGIDVPSVQFVIQYDFPGNLQQYVHRCGRAGRNYNPDVSVHALLKPTVYSFFTRNLYPLATDLIQLLEANQAWVDPNLRALAMEGPPANLKTKGQKKREVTIMKSSGSADDSRSSPLPTPLTTSTMETEPIHDPPQNQQQQRVEAMDIDDYDDDEPVMDDFPHLAPNRIVLRRASHVSEDPSSSSSEEELED